MKRLARQRYAFVVVLFTLFMPAGLVGAQEHQLTMKRDRLVGSTFQISVQGEQTQKQTQSVNGQEAGSNTHTVAGALTGVAEVLSLHEDKSVSSIALKIEKFEGASDDEPVTLDTTKRIVVTAVDGSTTFTYEDGMKLSDEAVEILDVLATFMIDGDPDDATDDQMFKLNEPRAVGSSWACDNELLANDMSSGGELVIDADNIESEFSFIEVDQFAGQPAAVFDVSVKLSGFTLAGAAENGLEITRSEGEMKMSGLMPLDPASGDGAMQMQMNIGITAEIKLDAGTLRMQIEVTGQADAEYRQIK